MKVLITGAHGFVAPYLVDELEKHGHEIILTGREETSSTSRPYFPADLTKQDDAEKLVNAVKPDALVHLAGISNVDAGSARRSHIITATNIDSTRFLCEAMQSQKGPAGIFLFVSTGLVFRPYGEKDFEGYTEDSSLGPINDYGWSKLGAEAIVQLYQSPQLQTYIVRPFNHIGPGQDSRFVCPALAQRIVSAPEGSTIKTGNLEAQRDFCDVRDVVRAYRLILEQKPQERIFVLGSGKPMPIKSILNFFLKSSGKDLHVEVSDEMLRTEHDVVFGVAERARAILGWKPEIPLEKTLSDIYRYVASRHLESK